MDDGSMQSQRQFRKRFSQLTNSKKFNPAEYTLTKISSLAHLGRGMSFEL